MYSDKCRSWYKLGKEEGRVVGLWPGSCLHAVRAFERPRWEDYNYEYLDGVHNRFHWLGDGSTYNDKYMTGDRTYFRVSRRCALTFCNTPPAGAWYLTDDEVDYPPGMWP